ncbi:MAG: alpha/beta fold hydrolase [Betaproteobacteria bacterium]|nr:alpha/beta fold hydrolase [Betaproteobacteria bacterium]
MPAGPIPLAAHVVGSGPDLLLFHGGRGSRNHWVRNVDALAAHFRVFALDLPGYGESPDAPHQSDPDTYFDFLYGALETLDLSGEPFQLVAFSFGAAVAASIAPRLGRRLKTLSLIGPSGFGPGPGYPQELRSLKGTEGPAVKEIIAHNLGLTMLSSRAAATDEAIAIHQANLARTRFNSHKVSIRASVVSDLKRVQCPVQILWGERDRLAHPSVAARVDACRAAVPSARLDLIPGAGHWAQFENAREANRLLLEFLREKLGSE